MTKKLALALMAVATLAAGAGTAAAADRDERHTLTLAIENVQIGEPTADCPAATLFAISFSLVSVAGETVGDGVACVQSLAGCDPFVVGCSQVAQSVFVFHLPGGSITADMTLHETFLTESTILQIAFGRITSGTGVYAGATGRIFGGGLATFAATGVVPRLRYFVLVD